MQTARAATFGVFALVVFAFVGCDGVRKADVSGTVKFDGHLVDDGAIAFYPADGKGSSEGGAIKNGQYSAKVPVGNMKVTVNWPKGTGIKKKLYQDDPKSPEWETKAESLPEKYSDANKTELTFEVKSGTNRKDWELTK